MGIGYSTDKVVPEFFWPHCDESRYVINMTWQLLLEALNDQEKDTLMRSGQMSEGHKSLMNIRRGRIQAYLRVLSRFDGSYCGEPDKILNEAHKELSGRNRPDET